EFRQPGPGEPGSPDAGDLPRPHQPARRRRLPAAGDDGSAVRVLVRCSWRAASGGPGEQSPGPFCLRRGGAAEPKTGSQTVSETGSQTVSETGSETVSETGSETVSETGSQTVCETGS